MSMRTSRDNADAESQAGDEPRSYWDVVAAAVGLQDMGSMDAMSVARDAMGPLGRARHTLAEYRFNSIREGVDRLVLTGIRDAAKADPWMPRRLSLLLQKRWKETWAQIIDAMKDHWIKHHAGDDYADLKKEMLQLRSWPAPPRACPNFLRALRCKVLYALFPADKSIFYVLRQPLALALALALVAPYGVSTLAWLLLFVCIDGSDEYQLAHFLALFKTVNFLKFGLAALVSNYWQLYWCSTTGGGACAEHGGVLGATDQLSNALFICSWALGWLVFALYKRRRAARVLELSDGYDKGEGGLQGAMVGDDSLLGRVVLYDLLSYAAILGFASADLALRIRPDGGLARAWGRLLTGTNTEPRVSFFFEMLTCVLGLSSAPFVVFQLPQLGLLILRLHPTGYDQAGGLRMLLSKRRMKLKWRAEQKDAKKSAKKERKASTAEDAAPRFSRSASSVALLV